MLDLLISIWLLSAMVTSFINTKASLCLLLSYMLFVPFVKVNFIGLSLGENFVYLVILLGFFLKNLGKTYLFDIKIFKPFLLLYGFYLVMIPFQSGMPTEEMFNSFRLSVMRTFILPFILWNAYKVDYSILKPVQTTLILSIVIICGYGLFLTQTQGFNPWLISILPLGGSEFNQDYAFSGNDGRMFGRISSVFSHPMTFGLFLCISLIYAWGTRRYTNKYVLMIVMALICLNILFCGIRSAIGGTAIGICSYMLLSHRIKIAAGVAVGAIAVLLIINTVPGMNSYISSITDVQNKNEDVNGSSIEMRQRQLNGCFKEIQNCQLVGKGYGWVNYYKKLHGDHPVMLAFESLIYVVLCNNGFLGITAWIVFIVYFFRMSWPNKELKILLPTLLVTYLAYSCITGEYEYMQRTLIMYVMILMNYYPRINNNINNYHASTLV